MDQPSYLKTVTSVIAETMGNETGELFVKFHELDDKEEIFISARALLEDFAGPKITARKLKDLEL
jgi:hypothetical protein